MHNILAAELTPEISYKHPDFNKRVDSAVKEHNQDLKEIGRTLPREKKPSISIQDTTKATDKYMVKAFGVEEIKMPHNDKIVIRFQDYTQDVVDCARKYLELFPMRDVPEGDVLITKTGFDLLSLGLPAHSFEWSSKSNINMLGALFTRQLSSYISNDKK